MDIFGTAGGLWSNYQNREFAEEMAGSQYQRAVADMKQAGLNPNAVFGSGGGSPAASPGGQSTNPVQGQLGSSAKSLVDIASALNQNEQIKATTKVTEAKADEVKANAKMAENEAKVSDLNTKADTTLMSSVGGKILRGFKEYGAPAIGSMLGIGNLFGRGQGRGWGGNHSAKQVKTRNTDIAEAKQSNPEPERKKGEHTPLKKVIPQRVPEEELNSYMYKGKRMYWGGMGPKGWTY